MKKIIGLISLIVGMLMVLIGLVRIEAQAPPLFAPINGYFGTTPPLTCQNGTLFYNIATQVWNSCGGTNVLTPLASVTKIAVKPFSITPIFTISNGDHTMTLTGNISSFTAIGVSIGQRIAFQFCQDSVGSRTISGVPSNVHGFFTVGATANLCSVQPFESFDGVNLYALSAGVINQ